MVQRRRFVRKFGPYHPDVAQSLNNRALLDRGKSMDEKG